MLELVFFGIVIAFGLYVRSVMRGETNPPPQLTEDQIRQQWRKLGFFCELDDERKAWRLTGSRAGLLYFPDLLLGYAADPQNAAEGSRQHYGPYGSLQLVTWPDPGFDANAIRGTAAHLTHLAELVETKLASAQPGEVLRIHEDYAPTSRYALLLDIRTDGFDPASADRERLGSAIVQKKPEPPPKPPK